MHPIGALGGANGGGGQNNFERSKGWRIGGGAPFDQSHPGHRGSTPLTGNDWVLLVVDRVGAHGGGTVEETVKLTVDLPCLLLIAPKTASVKESTPAKSDFAV